MLIPAPPHLQPRRIVVFDLDGTLCDIKHRLHFVETRAGHCDSDVNSIDMRCTEDWDAFYAACPNDEPVWPLIVLAQTLHAAGFYIAVVSGRSAAVQEQTVEWLKTHNVPFHKLFMRPEGNNTPDHELKKAWFEAANLKPEDVFMVLEDRERVVKMWRDLGLVCLQVKNGEY